METEYIAQGKEKRTYDAVVFDLDGTLLDTLDDLTASANAAAAFCGVPAHTRDEIRSYVGNGIRKLIERMLPEERRDELFDMAYTRFREHYADHCMDATEPYPGIISLLDWLKKSGYRTAIVSNKADFAVKKLHQVYFHDLIDLAAGEQEGIQKKPEPDMVYHILEQLQIPADRALYVGDSDVDIRTAANAGMDAVIVTWGFREKDFLQRQGARVLADNVTQLRQFIQGADEKQKN